jgi:phosphopantothenoylcysteine decarboxylase/phosphopantothenate--cysteine ligase
MGYAIAEAARDRGAKAVLVSAPTSLAEPVGVRVTHTETALEMREAVLDASADADALIMAAAVADWRPSETSSRKLKKGEASTWSIELTRSPDILSEVPADSTIKVGFAAESEDLLDNAQAKLVGKGLHLIAANDITAQEGGFGSDDNRVLLLDREGAVEELPLMTKYEVGHRILDRVAALLE